MSALLPKEIALTSQEKLYENETPQGKVNVYQTVFGKCLTLNDQIVLAEQDGFYYHEMMVHPALFTHAQPQTVAIFGNHFGILPEVLKHPTINKVICINDNILLEDALSKYFAYAEQADPRVHAYQQTPLDYLKQHPTETWDVIIHNQSAEDNITTDYTLYLQALEPEGIWVQPCPSPLLQLDYLKLIFQHLQQAGFQHWQLLNFPQPSYALGLRTLFLATQHLGFRRIRERDIYNRHFSTRYYNFDIHKAALALPEFAREDILY